MSCNKYRCIPVFSYWRILILLTIFCCNEHISVHIYKFIQFLKAMPRSFPNKNSAFIQRPVTLQETFMQACDLIKSLHSRCSIQPGSFYQRKHLNCIYTSFIIRNCMDFKETCILLLFLTIYLKSIQ